jgi:hypothetical protein
MIKSQVLPLCSAVVALCLSVMFACGNDDDPSDSTDGGSGSLGEAGESGTVNRGGRPATGGNGSGAVNASGGTSNGTAGSDAIGGESVVEAGGEAGTRNFGGAPSGGKSGEEKPDPGAGGAGSGAAGDAGAGEAGAPGMPPIPSCEEGFFGADCEPCACDKGTCNDGAEGDGRCTCNRGYAGTACDRCAAGYQDYDGNGLCFPACDPQTCSGKGVCDDNFGVTSCECFVGYTGDACDGCDAGYQDNDDNQSCLRSCDADTCNAHGTCDDSSGIATCTCTGGYTGAACDGCPDGFQDNDDNGTCLATCDESTCSDHGDCDDASGTATCTCDTGYTGAACDDCDALYQDNDMNDSCELACVVGACGSNGTCSDSIGAASCACNTGYAGAACDTCASGYQDNGSGCVLSCVEHTWQGSAAIPDSPAAGSSQIINFPETFVVGDVDLTVSASHGWISDIVVTVSHSTATVVAANRPGGNCNMDNWNNAVLDDEGTVAIQSTCANNLTSPPNYTPLNPLSAFDGQVVTGGWTVTVADGDPIIVGTFTYAKLRICAAATPDP